MSDGDAREVFVVLRWEDYEGCEVVGVWATAAEARAQQRTLVAEDLADAVQVLACPVGRADGGAVVSTHRTRAAQTRDRTRYKDADA